MADHCRCHLPLDVPAGLSCWWPQRDPEPDARVLVVSCFGQDPAFLRLVRLAGRWYRAGAGANHPDATSPVRWVHAGRCWDGVDHAVVDATVVAVGELACG